MFARLGGTQGGWGEMLTRQQTLLAHNSALKELTHTLKETSKTGQHYHGNTGLRKSTMFAAPPDLKTCRHIAISQLELGDMAKQCVLTGRLITQAIKMQSVQSVLEDDDGAVVTVHIYNVPTLPPMTTTLADLARAQALFPQGQRLAVLEPYFKIMLDGTYGVRVDNPAQVLFLDEEGNMPYTAANIPVRQKSDRACAAGSDTAAPPPPPAPPAPAGGTSPGQYRKPQCPNKSKQAKKRGNKP